MPKLEDRGSDEAAKMGKQAVDKMTATRSGDRRQGRRQRRRQGRPRRRRRRQEDAPAADPALHRRGRSRRGGVQGVDRVRQVPAASCTASRASRRRGNDEVQWEEKIWFSKRQWKGKITERRKNDRIAWKTTSGTQHSGIVSFHKIGDNLTRVMVTVDFQPTGMIEKMGSGLRFAKRAVEADLARFKTYVEMKDAKASTVQYGNDKGDDDSRTTDNGSRGKSNGPESSNARLRPTERAGARAACREAEAAPGLTAGAASALLTLVQLRLDCCASHVEAGDEARDDDVSHELRRTIWRRRYPPSSPRPRRPGAGCPSRRPSPTRRPRS